MKKNTITLPMLVFIAVLCVSIVAFPTTASGAEGEPDAVAGDVVALRSLADTFQRSTLRACFMLLCNWRRRVSQRFGQHSGPHCLLQRGPLQRL
ncbi:MAG: hypothetical protein ACLTSG_13660 [Lachnospiraceae bacterium]